jgi:hypothetical protein
MLTLILLAFAFVFAIVATFTDTLPAGPFHVRFGWLALAFLIASMLFGRVV